MKKDGRGGRQEDASRKPLLPQEERWAIGSACAHMHRESRKQATLNALDRDLEERSPVLENFQTLRETPVHLRAKVGSLAEDPNVSDEEIPAELDEPVMALLENRLVLDEEGAGLDSNPNRPTRPVGRYHSRKLHRGERRIEIVAEVAEVASKTYGISLKIDYVDQCWKEFRALERKLAEDIGH